MTMHDVNGVDLASEEDAGRSKTFMASVAGVGAIVALGLVLTVGNMFDDGAGPTPSAPSATTSASSASTGPTAERSVCGLAALEESGTVNLAPVTEWALVGTMAAPSIKDHGPGKTEPDGYRSCYARTPEGALLAAANYVAVASSSPTTEKAIRGLVVDGPGRDYALSNLDNAPATPPDLRVQIAGFQMVSYTGSLASVDLAFRVSSGGFSSQVVDLIWKQGDWKVRPSDTGSFLTPPRPLPSLTGYVSWSGA